MASSSSVELEGFMTTSYLFSDYTFALTDVFSDFCKVNVVNNQNVKGRLSKADRKRTPRLNISTASTHNMPYSAQLLAV